MGYFPRKVETIDGEAPDENGDVDLSDDFAALSDPVRLTRVWSLDPRAGGAQNTTVNAANRGVYMRAIGSGNITAIGIHVQTASGNISVAVFDDDGTGGAPGTRRGTSGAVACPVAGYAEVSLGGTVSVNSGDYLFLSADNNTAQFYAATSASLGSDLFKGACYFQETAHPAPASATPSAGFIRGFLLMGVPA